MPELNTTQAISALLRDEVLNAQVWNLPKDEEHFTVDHLSKLSLYASDKRFAAKKWKHFQWIQRFLGLWSDRWNVDTTDANWYNSL